MIRILLLSVLYPVLGLGQADLIGPLDTFIDTRDGRLYETIRVGNKSWFRDNLKYETAHSYCPNFNKKADDCKEGNFYSYQELDTICPDGWRVARIEDWEDYFAKIKAIKNIEAEDMEYDTLAPPNNSVIVGNLTEQLQLFEPSNPLNLSALGWVQGKKRQQIGTITFWAKNDDLNDNRFHVHIGPNKYVKHTHTHHIDDKPARNRKFIVKCVCEID